MLGTTSGARSATGRSPSTSSCCAADLSGRLTGSRRPIASRVSHAGCDQRNARHQRRLTADLAIEAWASQERAMLEQTERRDVVVLKRTP